MTQEQLATGLVWYVVFLLSLTCHEAAHALAALWGGDPTAARGGQVTLNPVPHIQREPLGTVAVPILSYLLGGWMIGWGSAPYDPLWRDRHPRRAAWMALAGPLANVALVLLAAAGIHLGIVAGILAPPESARFTRVVAGTAAGYSTGLAFFLSVLFSLNLLLASFNLLPIPPLDGNTAAGLLLSEASARRFAHFSNHPGFAMIGLIVCWKMFDYIFDPVFLLALNLLYPGAHYG
jgi:Zn-dependent protease